MMKLPSQNIESKVRQWCHENGWTEPFWRDRWYWAFAPNSAMPLPLVPRELLESNRVSDRRLGLFILLARTLDLVLISSIVAIFCLGLTRQMAVDRLHSILLLSGYFGFNYLLGRRWLSFAYSFWKGDPIRKSREAWVHLTAVVMMGTGLGLCLVRFMDLLRILVVSALSFLKGSL